jgi:metal transporter CNNM
MSLDIYDLRRKIKLGNTRAKKVYPLRKNGNLLLSTLLIGNVAVNSTLAVFLGSIASGLIAGITARALIVVFGEIMPQALFSRFALSLGAKTTWIVYFFLFVFYPVTKPISIILDRLLGAELPTVYSKREFREILAEQRDIRDSGISYRAFRILRGGLEYGQKKVLEVMTPRINTYFLRIDETLTRGKIEEIYKKGYSRIPVISKNRNRVIGLLYVKDLALVNPDDRLLVKKVAQRPAHFISKDAKLGNVLEKFQKQRVHMFVVRDEFNDIAGIVTLEDVIEEILGEIVDEYDRHVDMRRVRKD